jgi:hypothetical protein
MGLGEKLFEESGNITGLKITRVHPFDGALPQKLEAKVGFQAAKILAQV